MGLWDELLSPRSQGQWAWVWTGDTYERDDYASSFEAGRYAAAALRARGVERGEVVAAIITNSLPAVRGFLGTWMAGATLASLPIIARGQTIEDYVAQLRGLCASVNARLLLIEERFATVLRDQGLSGSPELITYESLLEHGGRAEIEPPGEDEVAFIQFSSGTTSEPRGVELTGRAIDAQLRALADHLSMDPGDVGVLWLPLSHDMGFFGGNILAWYSGMRGVLSPPERFLAQPWTWFEDCARFGATITVGPSFAYHVASRIGRTLSEPLALRACVTGGEHVVASHLRACAGTFGLRMSAFVPAYGLAEATLGVTLSEPGAEPRTVWARSEGLFEGELSLCAPEDPGARELVSNGRPLPGFGVSHAGDVGELIVSGPSIARGYHGQPSLTAARFRDGAVATGDVGFLHEGELFVAGRLDDRLIVGGRNVDVSDLEHEIAQSRGVRKGNCAVIDVRRGERQRIVLVAELDTGVAREEVLARVRELAGRRHGLRIDAVVALDRGQFPKTPSGKAQRYRCRQLALTEAN